MYEDLYGVAFYETLAKLFRSWKLTTLEFMATNEEIKEYDWIEGFFRELRRLLPELKDFNFSECPDLFKIKSPFKGSSKVFEIRFTERVQ